MQILITTKDRQLHENTLVEKLAYQSISYQTVCETFINIQHAEVIDNSLRVELE